MSTNVKKAIWVYSGIASGGPATAASQQHVSDFHKRPRFNEVPLPRPIVDVEKYLDDQDLVNVFAVFRQRQEQNLGMTLRSRPE
jgi:hypothetical protein